MIDEVLRIGDHVSVKVEQESREWGYDPCPDGTVVEVIGFTEHFVSRVGRLGRTPGVYENRAWCKIRLPDGTERTEWSGRFTLTDPDEYQRRVDEWRASGGRWGGEYLRPLPETELWEGDLVTSNRHSDVRCVARINYNWMGDRRADGSLMGFYDCSSDLYAGWHITLGPDDLTLVERGPVWKYEHGEPLTFDSLEEEAKFHNLLGNTEEVKNPACDLYKWDKDEALAAIRDGIGHAMTVGQGLFGTGPRVAVIKYHDENLGRRVAAYTLENF